VAGRVDGEDVETVGGHVVVGTGHESRCLRSEMHSDAGVFAEGSGVPAGGFGLDQPERLAEVQLA
jgi:hypothetical protein